MKNSIILITQILFFAAFSIFTLPTFAQQSLPDYGDAFLQNEVAVIRITIDPDSLMDLLLPENAGNEHEWPATFVYESSVLNDSVVNIGFRLRGNTSLNAAKKSFKVSFNSFQNQQWLNLDKLNLVGNQNDPSIMRAKLGWDAMRHFGLPSSRTSYIRLFINEEYKGLYVNTEHIDENFAKVYYGDGTGNMWKCLYPADLAYLGADPTLYKFELFGRRVYDLKNNNRLDDYQQIAHFIDVLNNTSLTNLPCELEKVFNVEDFLKYQALDILTGNWDGYAYNQNNYYLIYNEISRKLEYLPYDLDNTVGIDWVGVNWTTRDIYSWSPNNSTRPLYKRLMQIPAYRNLFSSYIQSFISNYFNSTGIIAHAQELQALIAPAVQEDGYYPLDFGFTYDDFLASIDEAWGNQIAFGLSDFILQRSATALTQLDNVQDAFYIHQLNAEIIGNDIVLNGSANVPSNSTLSFIATTDNLNSQIAMSTTFTPSSLFGEILYTSVAVGAALLADTSYRIYPVVTVNGNASIVQCEFTTIHTGQSPLKIRLNEIMASINTTVSDDFDEFNDWIELYLDGNTSVSLSGKFITDHYSDWNKWPLPNVTLDPGDFLLIWADDQPEQGPLHLGFGLDLLGERIALFEDRDFAPWLIDSISYPAVGTDQSFGRITDGNLPWVVFDNITPNGPNGIVGVDDVVQQTAPFIYPNPARTWVWVPTAQLVNIIDPKGKIVLTSWGGKAIDISSLKSGLYFVKFDDQTARLIIE